MFPKANEEWKKIDAVNADDLRTVWRLWPHLQEQKAGGLHLKDLPSMLSAAADVEDLIAHCAVLQHEIERGKIKPDGIDFAQASQAIPLPVRE